MFYVSILIVKNFYLTVFEYQPEIFLSFVASEYSHLVVEHVTLLIPSEQTHFCNCSCFSTNVLSKKDRKNRFSKIKSGNEVFKKFEINKPLRVRPGFS